MMSWLGGRLRSTYFLYKAFCASDSSLIYRYFLYDAYMTNSSVSNARDIVTGVSLIPQGV